jgi:hypothetical protein
MTAGKVLGVEIVALDQVFPSFRPVCHLYTPLPDSPIKTPFPSDLAWLFVFIGLAESRQKPPLPEYAKTGLSQRLKVRKSAWRE